jgi:predicted nucleotidyltransferase
MSDTTASGKTASGKFVLRIDPRLHATLRAAADAAGTSLNDYCARKLAAAPANLGEPAAAQAVARAAALVGEDLIAVAVFGSWARERLTETSDVDLLIVVDEHLAVNRELYRRWDEEPLDWDGRRAEPHFVHLPGESRRVPGLWAEVAVDGIVLFDRGFALSRRLTRLRRDIVAGRIVRREAHGQPYWVVAA